MILFTKNERERDIALDVVEKKTEELKMSINKDKSGIMRIHKVKSKKYKEEGETEKGYPVVQSYTYLGTDINYLGRADEQQAKINLKFERTKARMYPLLKKNDMRLNLNLFKVYIEPHYRMTSSLYATMCEGRKKELIKNYRKHVKSWCLIPKSVSNHVL